MKTRGAHHVSLDVRDIERSRAFYGGLLGLEEIARPDLGFPGAWYRAGSVELHLLQVPEGIDVGGPPAKATPLAQHLAFEIDDCASVRSELEAAGYEVIGHAKASRQLWVGDPDGNVIEFIRPER